MQQWLNKILLIVVLFVFCLQHNSIAQSKQDLELIHQQSFTESTYNKRKVTFLLSKSKNPIVRYNPVSMFFGGLLYFYQKALSPQISARCPYEISCSNFSKQCIQEFGIVKGIALSADRLTRCTRLASADMNITDISEKGQILDDPKRYRLHAH